MLENNVMFVIDITCAVDLSSSNIRGLKCVRKHVFLLYAADFFNIDFLANNI